MIPRTIADKSPPLILTMPTPPKPGGVATAAIASSAARMFLLALIFCRARRRRFWP